MAEIDGKAHGESWGAWCESHDAQCGEFMNRSFMVKSGSKKAIKKSQNVCDCIFYGVSV